MIWKKKKMNEEQIKDLAEDLYKIADNYQFEHSFDSRYYDIRDLAQNIEKDYLEQKRKYIVYADCRTFKSGIENLGDAKEWQRLIGGKIYMEISNE